MDTLGRRTSLTILGSLVLFLACTSQGTVSETGTPGTPTPDAAIGRSEDSTATAITPTSTPALPTAGSTPTAVSDPTFAVEQVFAWVDLDSPTFLTEIPDGSGGLIVLEQSGLILAFLAETIEPPAEPSVFLDIRDRVNRGGNEEGLLGLAFHPGYEENGRLFVFYSAASPRRSVISEFTSTAEGKANPAGERVILEIDEPYSNHNGGMIAFGPDGYLYIGVGDGGAGGDPMGNGQNPSTLLGSILRIDIDAPNSYGIPPDNPFANGADGAPEVWAYGLRNPWRFAFDPNNGVLWIADVGQDMYEEVSVGAKGGNYGWKTMEGPECYGAPTCVSTGLTLPVAWYDHDEGCSVTGGYVNRDRATPALNGSYVVADYCSGKVWRVDYDSPSGLAEVLETGLNISSFGEAADGAMYLVASGGRPGIHRIVQGDQP